MLSTQQFLGLFFGLLAVIFLVLALRRSSGAAAIAAKVYRRIAFIFAVVSAALLLSSLFHR
jgi:hypothetical protein